MEPLTGRALALAALLTTGAIPASSQTCSNVLISGDQAIWSVAPWMTEKWYRDYLAAYYNLQKDHWDESWGWAKYNDPNPDRFEFGKMMSAGVLLWGGIDPSVRAQSGWDSERFALLGPIADAGREVTTISRDGNSIDVLYRDNVGKLRHRRLTGAPWSPGAIAPSSSDVNVSDLVATSKSAYVIAAEFSAVSTAADRIDVFARQGNSLLHFQFLEASGWQVADLTGLMVRSQPIGTIQRYFIYSRPTAVRRGPAGIDVYAVDNFKHLIRYWRDGNGPWSAEDVTQRAPGDVRLGRGDPVPFVRGLQVSIFGVTSLGQLLRWHNADAGSWTVENVSELAGSTKKLSGTPAIVDPDGASTILFVRSEYSFLSYFLIPGFDWFEFDLTPETGPIEGDPVAVSRVQNSFDAFARGINDNLLHYYWPAGGDFTFEDLSHRGLYQPSGRTVSGPLTLGSLGTDRLDLFAPSWVLGQLTHYYWTPPTGWNDESVLQSPDVSSNLDQVVGVSRVVYRGPSSVHAFARRLASAQSLAHFTASTQLALTPWHRSPNYHPLAAGSARDFRFEPEYTNDAVATAFAGAWQTNRVEMGCPSFENGATPYDRASTMLHEATHINFWRWSHQSNPPGSGCNDPCSDDWFFHELGSAAGGLHHSTKNHSMVQLEVEFLCDLGEFPASWVPLSAYSGAKSLSNFYQTDRIRNSPGWTCGLPRPLE